MNLGPLDREDRERAREQRRRPGGPGHREVAAAHRVQARKAWVERYGWRATVSFVFYSDQNSVRILSEVRTVCQNSSEFLKFEECFNATYFPEYLSKFGEILIRIAAKFNEKCLKIAMFAEFGPTNWQHFSTSEYLLGKNYCRYSRERAL